MGLCYHKCFKPENDTLNMVEERMRQPSFMDNHCIEVVLQERKSKVQKEDQDHLIQTEEWYNQVARENGGKSLLDIQKFMEHYPHYKIDQGCINYKTELDSHWKKEDIDYLCNKVPLNKKKRSNCLAPDWKFLIRK